MLGDMLAINTTCVNLALPGHAHGDGRGKPCDLQQPSQVSKKRIGG